MQTLAEWLAYLERLHPREVELGLERVARVRDAMGLDDPPFRSIVVGGTNGKGACTVMLEAMLRQAGYRTGRYLSPHLVRYNERVCVDGVEAMDAELCTAFETVERARADISLTYFEFGTLAALEHFRRAACDWVVLEVGLGGRLDATNILAHEAALVVSVDEDHADWLGEGREAIGYEKAGIFRTGRPAICADPVPPESLLRHAQAIGAQLRCAGQDYAYSVQEDGRWDYQDAGTAAWTGLPRPSLPGVVQYGNAAAALATLQALGMGVERAAVERALAQLSLPGRLQTLSEDPLVLVDIAHNPAALRVLAGYLGAHPVPGRTLAVCAMLADKQIEAGLAVMDAAVDHWVFAGLQTAGTRGLDAAGMLARAHGAGLHGTLESAATVQQALERARTQAVPADRIVVFGSFHTVAAVLD